MLARTRSYTTLGLEALPIEIEVDTAPGLPSITIVGLPDQAVREARQRVKAAIQNSQFRIPSQRITVNLAPADVRKGGASFDLAIALGLLAASQQLDPAAVTSVTTLGELALDGTLRPIPGILPIALAARREGRRVLLPAANASEAALVAGLEAIPVRSLCEAAAVVSGAAAPTPPPASQSAAARQANRYDVDFADVRGQTHAKRALEVAVAGRHHVLLIGPPGSGKTMLAQRVPTIQPDLILDEALDVSSIHSVAGLLNGRPCVTQRPFRAPHHTSSAAALIGGGPALRPGEVSLAHAGVLFLDELPEFPRDALEGLRQPLEEGLVRIARTARSSTFPARFQLVAAMNPCICGFLTDPNHRCRCSSTQIQRYLSRISGPLLDRIDLHVDVPVVPFDVMTKAPEGEPSAKIRARVQQAIAFRRKRGQSQPNAQLRTKELKIVCELAPPALALLKSAMQELNLSARSYTKILKISRTIADLAEAELIQPEHIAEAIQYRSLDRQLWA